jgi:uncharacterized protein
VAAAKHGLDEVLPEPDRSDVVATAAEISFDAMGDGLTFISKPMTEDTEITGPLAAGLKVSSSTHDADIFLVFRVFSSDLREQTFIGAIDPHTPVAQGWLRASHRKLDEKLSQPYRPYHSHDEPQPLKPGAPSIWPSRSGPHRLWFQRDTALR